MRKKTSNNRTHTRAQCERLRNSDSNNETASSWWCARQRSSCFYAVCCLIFCFTFLAMDSLFHRMLSRFQSKTKVFCRLDWDISQWIYWKFCFFNLKIKLFYSVVWFQRANVHSFRGFVWVKQRQSIETFLQARQRQPLKSSFDRSECATKRCVRQSQRDNVLFIPHMIYGIISFHLLHTGKFMARIDVFKHFYLWLFSLRTRCARRARTHTHTITVHFSTTLLRRRLRRHTITQFFSSCKPFRFGIFFFVFSSVSAFVRDSLLWCVATCIGVSAARFYTLEPKSIVIAYRPAKASSSHNNLTATEWTAHTIFSIYEYLNARATTIARRTTNTFLLCAHTTNTTNANTHNRQRIFV